MIAQASADPLFGKLIANAFDQEQLIRNDLTSAQVQVGAMEGPPRFRRRQRHLRSSGATSRPSRRIAQGSNQGQRDAAGMLGLSVEETSRRIGFINALSGEARSSAIYATLPRHWPK